MSIKDPKKPTPVATLMSTEPDPTVQFFCFDCEGDGNRTIMDKQMFFRGNNVQYKLICSKHGETWVQL